MKALATAMLATLTLAVITATLVVYGLIAHFAGGITALVEKTFGGFASALSIIALMVLTAGFGWWQYWLSEHRERSSARSLLYAVIGVVVLIAAAVIGVAWVQWSWSLLWILLLMMPATLASWLITLINQSVFERE